MLTRAALTHRLKKMKSKMVKCKQCDNFIVVSGVECDEVITFFLKMIAMFCFMSTLSGPSLPRHSTGQRSIAAFR